MACPYRGSGSRVVARFDSISAVEHPRELVRLVQRHNFGHNRQTLRLTPAMEACIATHIWTVDESSVCSGTKV
jgi:hypothetical protein